MSIVREAVINAVVHADYSQTGGPVRIAFYDDRIEIENPGILLPGLTLEDVRQGVSKLRNRVIGRVFREVGLIEQWGSGVRRMFDEAESLGLPEPKIEEVGMRLRFTVYLVESVPGARKTAQGGAQDTAEVTHQATPQAPPHAAPHDAGEATGEATGEVAGEVKRLLLAMHGDMKRMDIQAALGLKHQDYFREAYLIPALQTGLIEMTIPDKPRSGNQKYRLTEKGRQMRKSIQEDEQS